MQQIIESKISKQFIYLLVIGIVANATGLFNDILEPDGALYASVAKNIVTKNDWINLYAYGNDWLDKPHLPFWLTAISFKFFGINSFAYKIPSFICFLVGVFYTYLLAAKIYSKQIAQIAVLIYITSLHVILSNFDVRAEGYLTAFIIASIYHFYSALSLNWVKHIVFAAFFAALAIMTKGIFVLITISSGFIIYWIITKQWIEFVKPKWYLLLVLIFIIILPELYCLYQQFDLHPEKLIFEKHHVSGIKFFFWDSQFGRFFNNGPIQGEGDILFFIHTTLWAFLPWSVYLCFIVYNGIKNIKTVVYSKAFILSTAAIVSFLLFSVSKFQLPHYIVIIFPLLSIIVANYLVSKADTKSMQLLNFIQYFIFFILIFFIAITAVFFKLNNILVPLLMCIIVTQIFYFISKEKTVVSIILNGFCFSVLLSCFLNFVFYPQLLKYQAGMMAGKWQQQNLPNTAITQYRVNEFSLDFYGNTMEKRNNELSDLFINESKAFLFTSKKELQKINRDSFNVRPLQAFSYFHISQLEPTFFNYKTRSQVLDSFVIVHCSLVK